MNRRHFILSSAAVALMDGSSSALGKAAQSVAATTDQALRDRLMQDPLRPQFHLLPQAGFVGDPCAPQLFRGQYHMFYHGSFGGGGWHHAMSPDMVHWKHLPIALSRTQGPLMRTERSLEVSCQRRRRQRCLYRRHQSPHRTGDDSE